MKTLLKFLLIPLVLFLISFENEAQDPLRFADEIEKLKSLDYNYSENEEVILFAGSSSIRKWDNLSEYFPDKNLIKMGFGGSQMSDLIYYSEDLIFNHTPDKIFVYEGDNDLADGKSNDEILADFNKMVKMIESRLGSIDIVFISPKPSIARWNLAESYISFNQELKAYTQTKSNLYFADVWLPLLNDQGKPRKDLFIEDDLHINEKGYQIWKNVLKEFMR